MNYEERRASLLEYLKSKVWESDWHGVSDAANDLRMLEAVEAARRERKKSREDK